jgi:hypothetical protein
MHQLRDWMPGAGCATGLLCERCEEWGRP